jgi:AcrR family transcriptional regulator
MTEPFIIKHLYIKKQPTGLISHFNLRIFLLGNVGNYKCFHSFVPHLEKMEPKERILKGTAELFFRYGIKSVTMDDIAKHLGISKKTIYQSFRDKDEIVHTLMEMMLKQDEENYHSVSQNSENIVQEIFLHMKHMGILMGQINPNAFYDLQKYHPASWNLFKTFKENCIQRMVEEALAKGIKDGIVRKDVNPKIMAKLRMEEVDMGFNPTLFPPDKYKVLEVQLALIDHFLHGVCTLKGHKLINKHKELIEEE